MTEVAMIAAMLAAQPRYVTAMEGETALDALAAAMLVRKQARSVGSPVANLSLREIARQLDRRSVLADGPRVDGAHEVQA